MSLEVAPGLRGVNDGPSVGHATIRYSSLENLLGWNPVVCTGTETLGLVEVITIGVQGERKEVLGLVSHAS